jgi:uncharacterized BrkB/YihY/UPF0761 family membrane protein
MTLTEFFFGLGDLFQWTFQIFVITGNLLNYAFITLGFIGLFYWLNRQRQFNLKSEKNPEQIK